MVIYTATELKKISAHIKQGGIIVYPTEYCFGLGCDPFNRRAIDKIIRLKGRNKNKGLIVIAGDVSQLTRLVAKLPPIDEYSKYWPGPYTLILPVSPKGVPNNLIGQHNKIAVRLSAYQPVIQLCNFLQMPLVSTSANYSGCMPAKYSNEVMHRIRINNCSDSEGIMLVTGTTGGAVRPSVIIDWDSGQILR